MNWDTMNGVGKHTRLVKGESCVHIVDGPSPACRWQGWHLPWHAAWEKAGWLICKRCIEILNAQNKREARHKRILSLRTTKGRHTR